MTDLREALEELVKSWREKAVSAYKDLMGEAEAGALINCADDVSDLIRGIDEENEQVTPKTRPTRDEIGWTHVEDFVKGVQDAQNKGNPEASGSSSGE